MNNKEHLENGKENARSYLKDSKKYLKKARFELRHFPGNTPEYDDVNNIKECLRILDNLSISK